VISAKHLTLIHRENNCLNNEIYYKDLALLVGAGHRKLSNIIIIDDDPLKYTLHLENGVPISRFRIDD